MVKVSKFFFPTDFYVLDMDDACDTLIILGRPFLATGGVCIDLTKGSIIFRVGSECEEFHVSKNVHTQLLDQNANRVHSLETCCMISKDKPLMCPKERELEKEPSARERVDKKTVESGSEKPKEKENDFVEGQHVYYFPPKNHFLYNPKNSIYGTFMITEVHSFDPIDIILHDHKLITVYRKCLKIFKGSTARTIWHPK